jgi:hypothetical protein
MSVKSESSFLFHGSAFGLAARFDHPEKVTIPTQAMAVLAPTGGEASSTVKSFQYKDAIMFEEATARVVGSQDPDGSYHTDVTATIRGLRFLQLVQADLIVARVNSIHRPRETRKGIIDEAEVTVTGSAIEGLYIAGKKLNFEMDCEVFSHNATFDKLRKAKRGAMYSHSGAKETLIRDSVVKAIDCQRITDAERKKTADPKYILPGVRVDGNVVWVPHFGKIFIGEVIIQRGYRRINMLRMELGCGTGGGGTAGGGEGNGGEIPPMAF